jgi:hypothetical protein
MAAWEAWRAWTTGAQRALLELGQALGHGVEVHGQGRDLVVPSTRAAAAKSFSRSVEPRASRR